VRGQGAARLLLLVGVRLGGQAGRGGAQAELEARGDNTAKGALHHDWVWYRVV
jgi:hypothetical protein